MKEVKILEVEKEVLKRIDILYLFILQCKWALTCENFYMWVSLNY